MRTTVTLDEDVAAKLKRTARERGLPFKVVLNDAVRDGLSGQAQAARRYEMPTYDMRVRKGVNLDKALLLADELEDTEIIRKLELGK